MDREALAIKGRSGRSGDCAAKAASLTWGDLASRLKGRPAWAGSEKSAEAIVVPAGSGRRAEGKGERTTLSLEGTMHQKSGQLELPLEARGEAPCDRRSGEVPTAARGTERSGDDRLMERVVENLNLFNRRMRTRMSGGVGGDRRG